MRGKKKGVKKKHADDEEEAEDASVHDDEDAFGKLQRTESQRVLGLGGKCRSAWTP